MATVFSMSDLARHLRDNPRVTSGAKKPTRQEQDRAVLRNILDVSSMDSEGNLPDLCVGAFYLKRSKDHAKGDPMDSAAVSQRYSVALNSRDSDDVPFFTDEERESLSIVDTGERCYIVRRDELQEAIKQLDA